MLFLQLTIPMRIFMEKRSTGVLDSRVDGKRCSDGKIQVPHLSSGEF
jgi:hypothetical protein